MLGVYRVERSDDRVRVYRLEKDAVGNVTPVVVATLARTDQVVVEAVRGSGRMTVRTAAAASDTDILRALGLV